MGRESAPRDDFLQAFGPVTVMLKRAENAMIVDMPDVVLKLSARVPTAGMRPTSSNRNRHLLDVAEAQARARDYVKTVEVPQVPRRVIGQVRTGGVIVAPYATTYGGEGVVRLTVQRDGSAVGPFVGASAFMWLRRQRRHVREYLGGEPWPSDGVKCVTPLSPEDIGDWLPMFASGLQTRGVFPWAETCDNGSYTLWLRDLAVTSWATVDYEPGREEFEVYQSGPRDLWDEVTVAYLHRDAAGRPGWERFGLTVDGEAGEHTPWLDHPSSPLPPIGCPRHPRSLPGHGRPGGARGWVSPPVAARSGPAADRRPYRAPPSRPRRAGSAAGPTPAVSGARRCVSAVSAAPRSVSGVGRVTRQRVRFLWRISVSGPGEQTPSCPSSKRTR
ncbi:protein-L-isoaspartate(D-aspartate)O-methyltransferase [Streptomyces zinciresistens K42]|uniref:Protein-L-isoaspartate(D-aspartate)O-methyltransferase n=1 Tax=Streptomyces zinciresistens K42 TaxID=700597 RepID=G2GBF2_9ACTN|nr:hypothetical protein [Streptomyces zinciresistens]EGX59161.1 protein-L-isoaspartate(D-aspartate)O-methyltransferase [Streptomyces zinciresistens K42]